jgi:hypothetical protein
VTPIRSFRANLPVLVSSAPAADMLRIVIRGSRRATRITESRIVPRALTLSKGIPGDFDQPERYDAFVAEYSIILAKNYAMQWLASQAAKVHGLWRNVTRVRWASSTSTSSRPFSIWPGNHS